MLVRQLERRNAPAEARAAASSLGDASTMAVLSVNRPASLADRSTPFSRPSRRFSSRKQCGPSTRRRQWLFLGRCRRPRLGGDQQSGHPRRGVVAPAHHGQTRRRRRRGPAAALTFDAGIEDALRELEAALPASEFKAEADDGCATSATPWSGVARFRRLPRRSPRHGLVVFEFGDGGRSRSSPPCFCTRSSGLA